MRKIAEALPFILLAALPARFAFGRAPVPAAPEAAQAEAVGDLDRGVEPDAAEPLPNFKKVDDGVLRSAQPKREGLEKLAGMGVKTILDLRLKVDDDEKEEARRLGLRVAHVGMNGLLSPTFSQLDRALAVLSDPAKRPVLVHCHYGRDRTGVVVAAYRAAVQGLTPAQAAQEAESFGCCPPLFKGLSSYLQAYLRHRQENAPATGR